MKEERKKNGKSHPVVLPSVQAAHNLDPSMSRPYAVVGGSSDTPLKPQLIIVVLFSSPNPPQKQLRNLFWYLATVFPTCSWKMFLQHGVKGLTGTYFTPKRHNRWSTSWCQHPPPKPFQTCPRISCQHQERQFDTLSVFSFQILWGNTIWGMGRRRRGSGHVD